MDKDILYPLRCIHGKLHDLKEKCILRRIYIKEFKKNPQTVFLLMTPEHDNIGDHAIAKAETDFLKKQGINYIEVTSKRLSEMSWANHLDVFNGFPILITGGGNLGTLWMSVEKLQREIVKKNPKSIIYVLPNTIVYEENSWGKEELYNSIRIYNHHKHLRVYARERTSYDFMKTIYRDVRLVPDMVLSLKKDKYETPREGCLLCLRGDCEKTRTPEDDQRIRQQAEELFGNRVADTDMVISGAVSVAQRERVLSEKFAQLAGVELVITDRLHGMIFCAITGTPCIVIDSKSPKVRGCYEWIKHLDYIRFADKPEDIAAEYHTIPDGPHYYDDSNLTQYYQILAEDIQSIWR